MWVYSVNLLFLLSQQALPTGGDVPTGWLYCTHHHRKEVMCCRLATVLRFVDGHVTQASPVRILPRFLFRQLRYLLSFRLTLPESTMKSRIIYGHFCHHIERVYFKLCQRGGRYQSHKNWKKRDKLDNIIWTAESSHFWSQNFPWSSWLHKPIYSLFGLGWFKVGFYNKQRVLTLYLTSTDNLHYQLCLSCLTSCVHITLSFLYCNLLHLIVISYLTSTLRASFGKLFL